jgi:hypothetical protein
MEAIADCLADVLNPLIDFEQYAPILLNPNRCGNDELPRVLDLNGISSRRGAISVSKLRRLAIIGPDMRAWRGSFRSHRTVASALTGGPVVMQTWVSMRMVLDESSMDMILLDDSYADYTMMFVLGQGPSSDYLEAELNERLDSLAKPVLDSIQLVPCFALTSWRNGIGDWQPNSITSGGLVLVSSSVQDEYEAVDMGPDVDAFNSIQAMRTPYQSPTNDDTSSVWMTAWFKTGNATALTYWEAHVFATSDVAAGTGSSYVVRVPVGNGNVTFHRLDAGVYGAALGTEAFNISDGIDGDYHRLDFVVKRTAAVTRLRVYVDGNPSAIYDDPVVAGRPDGKFGFSLLDTSVFTTGTLRTAALTFRRNDL